MNQEFPPRIGANIVTTSTPPTTVATGQQSAGAPLGREAPHIIADSGGQKVSGQSRGRKRERDCRRDIDSSDDESFDQEYSRWSEYARTRAKSKSPQPPKSHCLVAQENLLLKHSCINSNELQVAKGGLEKRKHSNY